MLFTEGSHELRRSRICLRLFRLEQARLPYEPCQPGDPEAVIGSFFRHSSEGRRSRHCPVRMAVLFEHVGIHDGPIGK
jgi:hypothetical protein